MQQEIARQVEAAHKQTEELIYQRNLSVMPAFNVWTEGKAGKPALALCNIGNGVAINVSVDPVHVKSHLAAGTIVKFDWLPVVNKNTTGFAFATVIHDLQSDRSLHVIEIVDPFHSFFEDGQPLAIQFQDLNGASYVQNLTLLKDETKVRSGKFNRPVRVIDH
jgi:hypothetical protein